MTLQEVGLSVEQTADPRSVFSPDAMGDVAARAGAANDYNAKVAGQAGKALACERQAEAERDSTLNGHEEPYQPVPKQARSYAQPFYNRLEDGDPRHGGDHRQKGRGKGKGKGQGKLAPQQLQSQRKQRRSRW